MTEITITRGADFDLLYRQLAALLLPQDGPLTNMANAVSFLYWSVRDVNWVGFYMAGGREQQPGDSERQPGDSERQPGDSERQPGDRELLLGPFHGKPACARIAYGQGVCGTAAQTRKMQNVQDVHTFPGHIPCDSASASELVIPIVVHGKLYAVLDVDSLRPSRFDSETEDFFLKCAALFETMLENDGKRV